MIFEFQKSFEKSLDKINDAKLKNALKEMVMDIQQAKAIKDIKNIKKLTGYKTAYRIKVLQDYRVGIIYQENTIYIVDFAHRKDIYKKFP
ncbi:MAG: type II toxin-antitoxin system RelE/ParE family toxin [Bacteroidota bacterium]